MKRRSIQQWTILSAARDKADRRNEQDLQTTLNAQMEQIIRSQTPESLLNEYVGEVKSAKDLTNLESSGIEPTPEVQEVLDSLQTSAAKSRRSSWTYKCATEAKELEAQGWYMLFTTLTFRDTITDEEIYKAWKRYYIRFRRRIADHCRIPATQCVKHFFYGEGDAITKRRHFHGIWYVKDIPASWKDDPNRGWHPCNRECPWGVDEIWSEGYAKHKAVRSKHDNWSKLLKWRWPMKLGRPLICLPVQRAVTYVTKYISEEFGENRTWNQRVKVSRGLGTSALRQFLTTLPRSMLRPLAASGSMTNATRLSSLKSAVPPGVIRREAMSERLRRCWTTHPQVMMRLRSSTTSKMMPSLISNFLLLQPRLSVSGRDSWQSCVEMSGVTAGRGCAKRTRAAWALVAQAFPATPFFANKQLGGI